MTQDDSSALLDAVGGPLHRGRSKPGSGSVSRGKCNKYTAALIAFFLAVGIGIAVWRLMIPDASSEGGKGTTPFTTSCSLWCSSPLLNAVETQGVFEDSKTFVDMPLKVGFNVEQVLAAFAQLSESQQSNRSLLADFVSDHFRSAGADLEQAALPDFEPHPDVLQGLKNSTLRQWALDLHALWADFARKPSNETMQFPSRGTLLPLPHTMVVPGGRFREVYYWDSYWIMLGLLHGGLQETAGGLVENMLWQQQQFGFVPNGARVYYAASNTRRSQPPLLSEMVIALFNATGDRDALARHTIGLEQEWAYWAGNHRVSLPESTSLFRYCTSATQPRPESYAEDVQHAANANFSSLEEAGAAGLFADIAAGAETGWDFSSRWAWPAVPQGGPMFFGNIRTSCVAPVELNVILYRYALNIAFAIRSLPISASRHSAEYYEQAAADIARSMQRWMWLPDIAAWADLVNIQYGHSVPTCGSEWNNAEALTPRMPLSAASFMGMWGGCGLRPAKGGASKQSVPCLWDAADAPTVQKTVHTLTSSALWQPNGIMTTPVYDGQQWDAPCGWAPLQWWLQQGLRASGQDALAASLAQRWLQSGLVAWQRDGVMFEKYNVSGPPGVRCSGGEYTPQSGFGWTNGVALDFLVQYDFQTLH